MRFRTKEARMDELSRLGQQALKVQPFSALVGARLASFSEGEAELEVPVREELLQQDGYVHGGVVSFLADNALTFAGGSVLGPRVLTQEY
jgi:acyl-coenzyme A thioesterase PaaI-like protein